MLTQLHTELPSAGDEGHHPMVGGARLVEHLAVAQGVAGSNPVVHPKYTGVRFS